MTEAAGLSGASAQFCHTLCCMSQKAAV